MYSCVYFSKPFENCIHYALKTSVCIHFLSYLTRVYLSKSRNLYPFNLNLIRSPYLTIIPIIFFIAFSFPGEYPVQGHVLHSVINVFGFQSPKQAVLNFYSVRCLIDVYDLFDPFQLIFESSFFKI